MTVFSLDRDLCLRELKRLAKDLAAARPEVEDVILFGSLATGRAMPFSDADLIVILRGSTERPFERIGTYRAAFRDAPIEYDLVAYTREEFEQMKAGPTVARSALLSGFSLLRDAPEK